MKLTDIPSALLAEYFEGKRTMPISAQIVKKYLDLKTHAHGEDPGDLIRRRRPNEPTAVFDYRIAIWEPITKDTWNKVIQSLGKIRRSSDWSIKYNPKLSYPKIKKEEALNEYCEKNFPYYQSVTNWMFSVGLGAMCVDANCAMLMVPLESVWEPTEYPKPYPVVFHSDQIIEFLEGRYAIFRAGERKGDIDSRTNKKVTSDKYWVITTEEIVPFVKVRDKWVAVADDVIEHGLGYLPIVRPRAHLVKTVQEYNIFESRLAAMLPHLNEAVREYSDIQAGVVNHIYPEMWEYATQECNKCNGSGEIEAAGFQSAILTGLDNKTKRITCPACKGAKYVTHGGPYDKTIIRPARLNMGEQPVPTPPKGIVAKDTDVMRLMDDRFERHNHNALASINMQFLGQTPLSISGDAKQVDRDELNNFVYNMAEDLIYIMDGIYTMTCDYRYRELYPDDMSRRQMLPYITVPQSFELQGADASLKDLTTMKNNNVGGPTVTAMEQDYANKKFSDRPELRDQVLLELALNPFTGISEADKLSMFQSGLIAPEDYNISCYIQDYVKRAIAENEDFREWDRKRQKDKMLEYATAKIASIKGGKVQDRQPKVIAGEKGKQLVDTDGTIYDITPAQTEVE